MAATERHPWATKYPALGTGPIPTQLYVSEETFAQEREKIFKKTWLVVGRTSEIPKPGDYKVKRIAIGDTSALLIRGKDGKIRAFHNMCSHRANKVVAENGEETFGRNNAAVVSCRFHGWVYDAMGRIVDLPQKDRFFPCFDASENGLSPIHCDVWAGFIFINLAGKPQQSLSEFLGGYAGHFGTFPYDQFSKCFAYHTYLNCNWKIGIDAFVEAYHVNTIHAGTFPNAGIDLGDVQFFGDHRTAGLFIDLTGTPPSPAAQLAQRYARASLAEAADNASLPPHINPGRRQNFIFELSVLFPNIVIHVTEGIWFTHQFWPISVDRTLWEGKYYLAHPRTNSERWGMEHSLVLQRNAWLEDTATMEATHEAARSRVKKFMHLQDEEVLVRHGYHVLERYLGKSLEAH